MSAVTGQAAQPSGNVHPNTVIRSISRPDDIMIAAAVNSTRSLGTTPSPRTSSARPTRKIMPHATKNGRIVVHADESTGTGPKRVTSHKARLAASTTARPPSRGTECA